MTLPADEGIHLSLPEIGSLCQRAARGAGQSWGMADEMGMAAQWLARFRFDWAGVVLSRLQGAAGADFTPAAPEWTTTGPICGLRAGVALADFATLPESGGENGVTLGEVHTPNLILPFAARTAALQGATLRLECDGETLAFVSGGGMSKGPWAGDGPARVRITPAPQMPEPGLHPYAPDTAIPTSVKQWHRLDSLALGMTVPASALSHAGAGAESSDND